MLRRLRGRGLRGKIRVIAPALDPVLVPGTVVSGGYMRLLREFGLDALPRCRNLLSRLGVFPLRDHYYEPLFDLRSLRQRLEEPRELPGLSFGVAEQLNELSRLRQWRGELPGFPLTGSGPGRYGYDNGNFGPGDAEILYCLVRAEKPRRIVEVGAGFSTLVLRGALAKNAAEGVECEHTAVEPFEMPWLEASGARVIRRKVEEVDLGLFLDLSDGDILFIDSSHMIRPGGDVLFLYQRVLPELKPGVFVHIHDIFTPYDYPALWLIDRICFWNEQYLVESLLAQNPKFAIHLALYLLFRQHFAEIASVCPVLADRTDNPPKSLWLRTV